MTYTYAIRTRTIRAQRLPKVLFSSDLVGSAAKVSPLLSPALNPMTRSSSRDKAPLPALSVALTGQDWDVLLSLSLAAHDTTWTGTVGTACSVGGS